MRINDDIEIIILDSLARIFGVEPPKFHVPVRGSNFPNYLRKISTGIRSLDRAMRGGIEVGSLTGFVGAFGSGKSQLCHQLAVMVQLPAGEGGLGSGAVYVDTEGGFRPERLAAMAEYRGLDPQQALEKTTYVRIHGYLQLKEALEVLRHYSLRKFKLLIIDSLAAPIRTEFYNDPRRVASALYKIVNMLSDFVFQKQVAIVVTDQVTQPPSEAPRGYGGWVLAGVQHLLWFDKLGFGRILIRSLKSPAFPSFEVQAKITEHGVIDVESYV